MRVPSEQHQALVASARAQGISMGEALREAIALYTGVPNPVKGWRPGMGPAAQREQERERAAAVRERGPEPPAPNLVDER
jgi:hypothetical protein